MNNAEIARVAKRGLAMNRPCLKDWHGQCYAAACELENYLEGHARYGAWWGPVGKVARLFFTVVELGNGEQFTRHGWFELPDGLICDPTRWAFEDLEPYIYVGPNDYYDLGANHLKELVRNPAPLFSPAEKPVAVGFGTELWRWIIEVSGVEHAQPTLPLVFWLVNLPLSILGERAALIYRALREAGYEALIPIDNREFVLGQAR